MASNPYSLSLASPWPPKDSVSRYSIRTSNCIRETECFLGLDLGQIHDPSAVAILERREEVLGRDPVSWNWRIATHRAIRHLHRFPLGTPYPDVVESVLDLVSRPELRRVSIVMDATGVGKPIVDLFKKRGLPCKFAPVTITGGDRQSSENGHWRVPKRDLIVGLVSLFQRGDLDLCGHLPETAALVRELGNMRVKITLDGHEKFGVWREGEHDDLVLAAALACWQENRRA